MVVVTRFARQLHSTVTLGTTHMHTHIHNVITSPLHHLCTLLLLYAVSLGSTRNEASRLS